MHRLSAQLFTRPVVIVIDPIATRRDAATQMGADVVLDPTTDDLVARVRGLTDGRCAVTLHLESQWSRDVTITTGLVDTWSIAALLRLVRAERLEPPRLVTRDFALADIEKAYDVFADAAHSGALKVLLHG